uniref:Uncharacterized protein n=1 Tax=Setaria digitata TaxID=48799 RepID=A0A915PSC1_9BILA
MQCKAGRKGRKVDISGTRKGGNEDELALESRGNEDKKLTYLALERSGTCGTERGGREVWRTVDGSNGDNV